MSQESADEAPPSSEEADPISLRDVELEPVSLHDIERILAPGRSPPKLASTEERAPPAAEPPPAEEPKKSAEVREGLATTVSPAKDDDDDRGPDSAINDLRALAAASKAPPADRESLVNEVLHMGSIMGDAPPPPLIPTDLAAFVKEKPAETTKLEGGSKPRPKPPLKQKRPDASPSEAIVTDPPPANDSAEPASRSAAPAKSVTPRASRSPSTPSASRPKASDEPEPRSSGAGSRALLIVVAAAALLGLGYWLGGRDDAPAPGAAPTVTVVVTERAPVETAAPPASPTETSLASVPEDPPPQASASSPAPALTGRLAESAAGTIPAATTSATVPPPSTAAPSSEPPAAAVEFDKSAANAALASAVASASACKQEGDPSGQAKVQVTFAPSGRVTVANILGPPFAGTKTGGCIAMAFRSAKVPPFSGDPVTVSKTVAIP